MNKKLLVRVAECIYSSHEMIDIEESIMKGCNAAIAMLYLEKDFRQIEYREEYRDISHFTRVGLTYEELVTAFRIVTDTWMKGHIVTGYTGVHPAFEVDRFVSRFPDDSVLVYWGLLAHGNKNQRDEDDYYYTFSMKEFIEEYT